MKLEKKVQIVLYLLWAVLLITFCYLGSNKVSKCDHPEEFIEKIDSLESQIDSIYVVKDSIYEKINTVYVKLEDNDKQYEENFNRVINNDANEDYVFFLDYINSNRTRLDSISNSL